MYYSISKYEQLAEIPTACGTILHLLVLLSISVSICTCLSDKKIVLDNPSSARNNSPNYCGIIGTALASAPS